MDYYITDLVPIRPRYEIDQERLLEWIAQLHSVAADTAKLSTPHSFVKEKLLQLKSSTKDKILKRGIQISDPFEENYDRMQIYPVTLRPEGANFKERMQFFDREALKIFEQFYPEQMPLPPHLIHVTCTGYVAPSPAQKIVSKRNAYNTAITHAYHMGCYAAIPAIHTATGFLSLSSVNSSVDIVHTEMCSLHMHPLRNSTEELIIQSLFADGFIKYSLYKELKRPSLHILSLHQEMIPNSLDCMSWCCEDICHSMTLSKTVPVFLTRALSDYFSRLLNRAGITNEEQIKKEAFFAVHPGGPKIIEHVKELFGLRDEQMLHTVSVLKECANMSSATLPHIWERIVKDDSIAKEAFVVSLAFGPGLTIAGALFKKIGR